MRNELFRLFLDKWYQQYSEALAKIDLFRTSTILSERQQLAYVAAFQTFRGHFIETVMVPVHRLAKDASVPAKYRHRVLQGVVGTLRDELGLDAEESLAHDELYQRFAHAIGANADAALWDTDHQPLGTKRYNQKLHGYLTACLSRGWSDIVRGLTVYLLLERVDEVDYLTQLGFASRFSLVRQLSPTERARALEFFSVHAAVQDRHFESIPGVLDENWETHAGEIQQAAEFLAEIHLCMYLGLSNHVLGAAPTAAGVQPVQSLTS